MLNPKAQIRVGTKRTAIVIAALLTLHSEATAREAILADGTRRGDVDLIAASVDGTANDTTLVIDGTPLEADNLIRWGDPLPPASRPGVVLADGSRLFSDREWAPNGLVQVIENAVRLRRGGAWIELDRGTVGWVLLSPNAAGLDVERLPDIDPSVDDVVLLADGDQVAGRIEKLASGTLEVTVAGQPIETPLEKVAAVRLAEAGFKPMLPSCLVGLDDGSLLHATRLVVEFDSAEVTFAAVTMTVQADTLSFLQPLGNEVRYLSDMEPVDYRHTPYIDLAWPYARDRGLRGGPLAGGGRRAAKGLAMHSAARLVYRLDGSSQRFQAELAVADPQPTSAAIGSVAYRVYLVKEGGFQAAYEGSTQRVGDPAVPIDIDVTGAAAIALVVDYADNGDAGDDALWLDARLVRTP